MRRAPGRPEGWPRRRRPGRPGCGSAGPPWPAGPRRACAPPPLLRTAPPARSRPGGCTWAGTRAGPGTQRPGRPPRWPAGPCPPPDHGPPRAIRPGLQQRREDSDTAPAQCEPAARAVRPGAEQRVWPASGQPRPCAPARPVRPGAEQREGPAPGEPGPASCARPVGPGADQRRQRGPGAQPGQPAGRAESRPSADPRVRPRPRLWRPRVPALAPTTVLFLDPGASADGSAPRAGSASAAGCPPASWASASGGGCCRSGPGGPPARAPGAAAAPAGVHDDPGGAAAPDRAARDHCLAAGRAGRAGLVSAGPGRRVVRQPGPAGPGQEDHRAAGARHDHRQHRGAAGPQPVLAGGFGEHGGGERPARRRQGRAAPAGRPAGHARQAAAAEDPAVHGRGVPAVLGRVALPADPGGRGRAAADRAAGAGEPPDVPRGVRAGPAGHPVPQPGQHRRRADPGLPAADHPAAGGPAAPDRDRLLRRRPGRPVRARAAVRPRAARPGGQPGGLGQRRGRRHRDHQADRTGGRRHAGHQPQREDPAAHPERAGHRHPQDPVGRQPRRHHRRRGGDDHHRPGGRDGQLPDLRPVGVDRRHHQAGVLRAVRGPGLRADPEPGHPGPVRARVDLEGDLDRGRGGGRLPAERPVRLPQRADHRRHGVQQRLPQLW